MRRKGQKISKYLYYYLGPDRIHFPKNALPSLNKLRKAYIVYLLELTDNNLIETAEILNIPCATLKKKLNKYSLTY